MPRGAKPGERRGGREKGTPNKTVLVRLDKATAVVAAQVSALKAEDNPWSNGLPTLGR